MTHPIRSKLVLPAAVVGCALTAGLTWRMLGSEATEATVGVEFIAPHASVVESVSRYRQPESTELVSIEAMETLLERQARAADEKAANAAVETPASEDPEKAGAGSMELVIQLPPKDRVEGETLRVVLDEPGGGTARGDWKAEADVQRGTDSVLLDNLPAATSFRLRIFQGENLYASTTVQSSGRPRTTIELDFITKTEQEQTTIAVLRSIAAAQQQLQASAAIDTDADGGGEFGYFAELAGTQPIRSYGAGGATLDPNGIKLDPTYLPPSMGVIEPASEGGVTIRDGYAFLIYLPDSALARPIGGIAESVNGGNTPTLPGSASAELMWCCYAWPVEATTPMKRAFMINQARDVIGTTNEGPRPYVGLGSAPPFDAAYSSPGDMASEPGLAAQGLLSTDRRVWDLVGT